MFSIPMIHGECDVTVNSNLKLCDRMKVVLIKNEPEPWDLILKLLVSSLDGLS